MNVHDIHEAEPALRARHEELGTKRWAELAGALAWVHGGVCLALVEGFVPTPRSIEKLNEALRGSQTVLDSEAVLEEVMGWRPGRG